MLLRAFMFVVGVAGALVPRKLIGYVGNAVLVGYENPQELEPSEWYVSAVRATFAIIAVAALVAPFLPTPSEDDETGADGGPVIESDAEA